MEFELFVLLFMIIIGIGFTVFSFLATLGLLIDRQILCFLRLHRYESRTEYKGQAVVCQHCYKIKYL